jgi:hypothetical protein
MLIDQTHMTSFVNHQLWRPRAQPGGVLNRRPQEHAALLAQHLASAEAAV